MIITTTRITISRITITKVDNNQYINEYHFEYFSKYFISVSTTIIATIIKLTHDHFTSNLKVIHYKPAMITRAETGCQKPGISDNAFHTTGPAPLI